MEIVKILLGEDEKVEQVARTSKHILVFVLVSQLYSYLYIALLLLFIHICLILCLHLF